MGRNRIDNDPAQAEIASLASLRFVFTFLGLCFRVEERFADFVWNIFEVEIREPHGQAPSLGPGQLRKWLDGTCAIRASAQAREPEEVTSVSASSSRT